MGQALKKIEETKALEAWADYVGPSAAEVSTALKVRSNTLIVKVTDPLWMQQLTFLKRDLLSRFKADFPKLRIRNIYFTRTG